MIQKLFFVLVFLFTVICTFPQLMNAQEYRFDEKMIKTQIELLDDMTYKSRSSHFSIDYYSKTEKIESREYKNNYYIFSMQNIDDETTTRMMTLNFYFFTDSKKIAFVMLSGKDKKDGKWVPDGKKTMFNVDKGNLYVTILKDDKVLDMYYGKWPYPESLSDHYQFNFDQE